MIATLSSGAGMRRTGPEGGPPVVCVNGGTGRVQPGDWSASLEWLVGSLAARFPALAFHEVRYRVKSWKHLDECIEDARAALDAVRHPDGLHTLMIGFSMGGAVAIGSADHPSVSTVVGLAPWIPPRMDIGTLEGRRLAVIHGSLDGGLPGVPGVSPRSSRAGVERVSAAGVETSYSLIRGAVHPIAVRRWGGRPLPLPRARTWARLIEVELRRFQAEEDA
jgi:pimeloyl-ACP methyl ester carboxylesterase